MTGRSRRHLASYLFLFPYLTSFTMFVIVPFLVALVLAFLQCDLTNRASVKFGGLGNFQEALFDSYFWKAVRATVTFVLMMVPSTMIVALALAIGLDTMTLGRNVIRAILYMPGMLNVAVVGILWQWFYNGEFGLFAQLFRKFGLEPIPWLAERSLAMPSIVVMSLWWNVGGTAVVFLVGIQQIPTALYEAAAMDGASAWQRFQLITLPQLRPVMGFVAVMNTIRAFQVFGEPFMLTRGGPELATRGVVQYIYETAFNQYRMGYGAAMSWLLFLLIAVFAAIQYLFLRRANA